MLFVQHGYWNGLRCVCTSLLPALISPVFCCPIHWKKKKRNSWKWWMMAWLKPDHKDWFGCLASGCFIMSSLKPFSTLTEVIELQDVRYMREWIPRQGTGSSITWYYTYCVQHHTQLSGHSLMRMITSQCLNVTVKYGHTLSLVRWVIALQKHIQPASLEGPGRPWSVLPRCSGRSL